jgi:hypothetical protein
MIHHGCANAASSFEPIHRFFFKKTVETVTGQITTIIFPHDESWG